MLSMLKGGADKAAGSIKGVFFGIVLFFLAFPFLWWGENRQDLSEFVKNAQEVQGATISSVAGGTLVKLNGQMSVLDPSLDDVFFAAGSAPKSFLVQRNVQMYAWKEKVETKGKGENKTKEYSYVQEWTSSPADSSNFHKSAGHLNPAMFVKGKSFKSDQGKVDGVDFESKTTEFYSLQKLPIQESFVNRGYTKPMKRTDQYLYIPVDSMTERDPGTRPKTGDIRISFSYFPSDINGTVVGEWNGQKIVPHFYDDTDSFIGAYAGSSKAFYSYLKDRHTTITWVLRIVALLAMWGGLNMILGPISMVLDFIPVLGDLGKAAISMVTGLIAFVLWGLTIFLANFWLLLLVLIVLGVLVVVFMGKQKQSA